PLRCTLFPYTTLFRSLEPMTRRFHGFALAATIVLLAPVFAHAQSADLVLCDRLAADGADPDKPADIKGVAEVAPSDVETAIGGLDRKSTRLNSSHVKI